MTDARLTLSLEGGIARLTLRRPERLNALDAQMIETLGAFLEQRQV